MNKKLYKFISKEMYETLQRRKTFYEERKKELPESLKLIYKESEDGKYYRPKPLHYERVVQMLIREKYNEHDELGIQRKRDTEPEKFREYYDYVESCIAQAKEFEEIKKGWDK